MPDAQARMIGGVCAGRCVVGNVAGRIKEGPGRRAANVDASVDGAAESNGGRRC